jgi:hypothetical protein
MVLLLLRGSTGLLELSLSQRGGSLDFFVRVFELLVENGLLSIPLLFLFLFSFFMTLIDCFWYSLTSPSDALCPYLRFRCCTFYSSFCMSSVVCYVVGRRSSFR